MTAPVMEIQKLILETLTGDPAVMAIATAVYDNVPSDAVKPYISFGPADQIAADAARVTASEHFLQLDVWSARKPRAECAELCQAARAALHRRDLFLQGHALVAIRVPQVRILRDPDGLTNHGILSLEILVEEM